MAERRLDQAEAQAEALEIAENSGRDAKGKMLPDSIKENAEVVDVLHDGEYEARSAGLLPSTELFYLTRKMNLGAATPQEFERIGEYKEEHVMGVAVFALEKLFDEPRDLERKLNDLANLRDRYPEIVERAITREIYEKAKEMLKNIYLEDDDSQAHDIRRVFKFPKEEVAAAMVEAGLENIERASVKNGASLLARFISNEMMIACLRQNPRTHEIMKNALDNMKARIQEERGAAKQERYAMIAANLQVCLDAIEQKAG